jgi:hypothetical protein
LEKEKPDNTKFMVFTPISKKGTSKNVPEVAHKSVLNPIQSQLQLFTLGHFDYQKQNIFTWRLLGLS